MIDWDAVSMQELIQKKLQKEYLRLKDSSLIETTVKKWRVKEEWFFDKQSIQSMDVRILGLAPLQEDRDEVNRISC